jgi:hypothetical protein
MPLPDRAPDALRHPRSGKTPSSAPGTLSLNIFYQLKQPSLCVSNCRSIEVSVIYPRSASNLTSSSFQTSNIFGKCASFGNLPEKFPAESMSVDQEHTADLSLVSMASREGVPPTTSSSDVFRFMDLPLELRLKIYGYLLPSRTHTIVTQLPNNGYFYNTATVPQLSAQSFYPFGRTAPKNKLTTYKVLTTNFRSSFPAPSIHPQIFLVSRQIRSEAEPILYGSPKTVFDFGVHLEALVAFFGDRSEVARNVVKNVRIAQEIPAVENRDGTLTKAADERWTNVCSFIRSELANIRTLDLTMWSSSGSVASFPSALSHIGLPATTVDEDDEMAKERESQEVARKWREWEWTRDLLSLEALRKAKVTWWGFQEIKGQGGTSGFDSWLAGRMVSDKLVRDRMVREGVVVEGFVLLDGAAG